MKHRSWWSWAKAENEKTYGKYCGHKDRLIMSRDFPDNPTGKFDVTCSSCGAKAEWNGKDYNQKLPKTLFKEKK